MWDGRSVPNYMSFSAGGTYGLMYIGMYRALRDHVEKTSGISGNDFFEKLKGVSGVSAGALAALCLLLDKMDDLHDIFADKMLKVDRQPRLCTADWPFTRRRPARLDIEVNRKRASQGGDRGLKRSWGATLCALRPSDGVAADVLFL